PRGSADLIHTVVQESTVPVIETGAGIVHVYVDASADQEMALKIVHNAKTHRPSECNAAETLLVHREAADRMLPELLTALSESGVSLSGDSAAQQASSAVTAADDETWATEHHALVMGVRVVESLDEALTHIAT